MESITAVIRELDQTTCNLSSTIYKLATSRIAKFIGATSPMAMKLQVALFFISLAGMKLSLAQDVIDCTDIAADLNTMAMDPVTGKAKR